MQTLTCNLCGSADYAVVFRAGEAQTNQIVKCRSCGLMYANPRSVAPDHVEIAGYDADFVEELLVKNENPRLQKEALQVRDYATTREFLGKRYPQRGKLLEVGSGLGYLLDYFKKDGWATTGVEPNRGMCRYAQKVLGVDAIPEILPDAKFADASFDAVLMMHVIEHVPDPTDTLAEIHRVLRPGGTLVMETPRYDTLTFKLLGRRERSVSCDGHIYFFTSDTLARIATKTGYSVIRQDPVGRSMTAGRLLYNVGVVSKSKGVQKTLESLSKTLRLDGLHLTLNLHDMERIYLRKGV
jgi:SAM-dependent methyltransferase